MPLVVMLFIKSLGRLASTDSSTKLTSSSSTIRNLITIKDSCLNRLRQILKKPEEEFLRINVETGGCSGFSYVFDIESKHQINPNEDLVFERENYRVVVNKDILPYMKGSSIEFNESLIKSSFQIVNPIAETRCSCGSSFSVDFTKLNQKEQRQEPLTIEEQPQAK